MAPLPWALADSQITPPTPPFQPMPLRIDEIGAILAVRIGESALPFKSSYSVDCHRSILPNTSRIGQIGYISALFSVTTSGVVSVIRSQTSIYSSACRNLSRSGLSSSHSCDDG